MQSNSSKVASFSQCAATLLATWWYSPWTVGVQSVDFKYLGRVRDLDQQMRKENNWVHLLKLRLKHTCAIWMPLFCVSRRIGFQFGFTTWLNLQLYLHWITDRRPKPIELQRYVKLFAASGWEELGTALGLADEDDGQLLNEIENTTGKREWGEVFLGGSDCLAQGIWTSKGTLLLCLKETEMHESVRSISYTVCRLIVKCGGTMPVHYPSTL